MTQAWGHEISPKNSCDKVGHGAMVPPCHSTAGEKGAGPWVLLASPFHLISEFEVTGETLYKTKTPPSPPKQVGSILRNNAQGPRLTSGFHTHAHICVPSHKYTLVYPHIRIRMHTCMHMYIHKHIFNVHFHSFPLVLTFKRGWVEQRL